MSNIMGMLLAVSPIAVVFISIGCAVVGLVGGFFGFKLITSKKLGKAKSNAVKILEDAYAEAKTVKKEAMLEAKEEILKLKQDYEREQKERRSELQKTEDRLIQREEFIDKKETALDRKSEQIETLKNQLDEKEAEIDKITLDQVEIKNNMLKELEKISGMKKEEAKQSLIESITENARRDAAKIVSDIEEDARENGLKKAKNIVAHL